MNSSLWICEQIIYIVSLITESILYIGEKAFGTPISFSSLINHINSSIYVTFTEFNLISFDGIIKSFTSFGLINLLFTYSLRYIMFQIFILFSPFAFLCLITDQTSWFFKAWIKSFLAILLVQILIATILTMAFAFNLDKNSNLIKLLFIGVIYALSRANGYMKEIFGGISTDVSTGISTLKNFTL